MKGEIINIGSGKMTLLLELARLVINLSGKSLDAVIEGQPSGEPMCLQADMRKVLRLLDFDAQISLAEGLSLL